MKNFWQEIKRPILCLAPMADVTDAAFRYIIAKYSKQNYTTSPFLKSQGEPLTYVTYTEFVSADGLVLAPKEGRKKLLKNLEFSEIEKPIVAQFFTNKPEMMKKVAALAVELGFDGIDINMGCPDRSIEKQGAGAALIKNPKLAREIIAAAKFGIKGAAKKLNKEEIPVSVKTRLGYNKDELETWLPELLAENPAAIIIHARTRKEMSKVPARWERIKRAVEIRNNFVAARSSSLRSQDAAHISLQELSLPLIIGNGDVADTDDGRRKCEETGADGAMLGRAVFGNPFLFRTIYTEQKGPELVEGQYKPTSEEKLKVLIEHTKLFEDKFFGIKSFAIMKKHFKAYITGLDGAKKLRDKLMKAENAEEVEKIVKDFLILYN